MRWLIFFLVLLSTCAADFADFNEEMHLSNVFHQLSQAEDFFSKKEFDSAFAHYLMAENSNTFLVRKNSEYTLRIFIGKAYTEMILKGSKKVSMDRLSTLLRSLDTKNADFGKKRGARNNE